MNIWDKMKKCESELTPKELEVYKLLLEHPYLFSSSTAGELASRFGIAQSAISRFCQKIGYEGFSDFRLGIALALSAPHTAGNPDSTETHDLAYSISQLVLEINQTLPGEPLDRLADRVIHSTGVYLAGSSNSNPPAHLMTMQLLICGIPAHLIQTGLEIEMMHIIKPTDVVFLFSAENPTHQNFLEFVGDLPVKDRPYLVLICNTKRHPLRKLVNEVISLPSWSVMQHPVYLDSSLAPTLFCYLFSARIRALLIKE